VTKGIPNKVYEPYILVGFLNPSKKEYWWLKKKTKSLCIAVFYGGFEGTESDLKMWIVMGQN
jgi:hypothetical protein